ncbi:MAG: glycosyltransferase family 2 protein [Chitinophagaceae bacterium]
MMVSVIIVNYNTYKLTSKCIQSVINYTKGVDYEIILVDNNSTECNADDFLVKFPTITLIKNPANGGFAQGNNCGIAIAKGKYILLLNSDTYLLEDSISIAVNQLSILPTVGVLGIKMVYENKQVQYTARRFRSFWWELLDLFRFFLWFLPYQKRAKIMLGKYFKMDFAVKCDWVNGAFFLFKKEILSKLPNQKLDDRFFMYGEDHLWCFQFAQLGYEAFYTPSTTIVHINNGSTSVNKQFQLLTRMLENELVILKLRYGNSFSYYATVLIYGFKEYGRIGVKWLLLIFTGKLLK